jgi:hypothetical protein
MKSQNRDVYYMEARWLVGSLNAYDFIYGNEEETLSSAFWSRLPAPFYILHW